MDSAVASADFLAGEVTFDIDANGILKRKGIGKATNKSQSVRIEASTSLSKDEIERLKNEAMLCRGGSQ